jgi:PTH1 family peptidyl-tRNA hydrolase
VLGELARRNPSVRPKSSFQGEVFETDRDEQRVLFLGPQTYMNNSGASVLAARDFYKLENHEVLIVCDDFNLPLAKLRFRGEGSAGGQKGLADVIERLGAEDVPRLRIGVGPVPPHWDPADFVLGRFTKQELAIVEPAIGRAADAVEDWISRGIEVCMNRYNA